MNYSISRIAALFMAAAALLIPAKGAAQDFISREAPQSLFNIGLRLGLNASNRTVDGKAFPEWNRDSWGTGFDAGVVVDINVRDFLSVQPGFFYESRSGNYAYASTQLIDGATETVFSQMGHYRSYNFEVPVMVAFHFNLSPDIRWNVDFGPDFRFRLHNSDSDRIRVVAQPDPMTPPETVDAALKSFDFGLRFGTGLTLKRHYVVEVHYVAGLSDAWKTPGMGGCNKVWQFAVGYNF